MLCPIESTEHDFVEPPKSTHKKKNEKDREKDRVEREQALKVAEFFRKKQEEQGKPVNPREPLKRTANNNWVHVICAVFTPEVKFGNANALEPSEGIPSISSARYEEVCKVCKKNNTGACVGCHSCKTPGKNLFTTYMCRPTKLNSPCRLCSSSRLCPGIRRNACEGVPTRSNQ